MACKSTTLLNMCTLLELKLDCNKLELFSLLFYVNPKIKEENVFFHFLCQFGSL